MADQSTSDVDIVVEPELADPSVYLYGLPPRLIASLLGLMGFSTACAVGLVVGNPSLTIIVRSMVAMVICYVVGRVLGYVGEVCIREYLDKYSLDHPEPEKPAELRELDREKEEHDSLVSSMQQAA